MAYSVFISYSTRDLSTAQVIRQWINSAGADGFLAEFTVAPGRPLADDIIRAIKECDLFLLLWSTNARGSEWVPQEIGIAKGAQKPIVPVVLHENLELPGFIRDLKYLPLHRNPQGAVEWLHKHVVERRKTKEVQGYVAVGVLSAIVTALLIGGKDDG